MSDSDKEAKEVVADQVADEMETSESDVSGLAKAEEKDSSVSLDNISKESTGVEVGKNKITSSKRGLADDDGGMATPAKRRTRVKGKNGSKKAIVGYGSHAPKNAEINNIKKVKKEDINNVEPVTPTSKPVTPTSTPVKRSLSLESQVSPTAALKRVPAETKHGAKTLESPGAAYAPITPKSNGTGEGPIDGNTVITPTVRKRKRSVPTSAPSIAISTSLDTVTPEDRMLLKMRDDGENWSAIRTAWKNMTGILPGASTLPNRYNRLKANLTVLKEGDVCTFLFFPFQALLLLLLFTLTP